MIFIPLIKVNPCFEVAETFAIKFSLSEVYTENTIGGFYANLHFSMSLIRVRTLSLRQLAKNSLRMRNYDVITN